MSKTKFIMISAFLCIPFPALSSFVGSQDVVCIEQKGRDIGFTTVELTDPSLDISPDGKSLAFDLLGDIYVVKVEGGEAVKITNGKAWDSRPVWAKDSKKIAFISDIDGEDHVFMIDVSGKSEIVRVTDEVIKRRIYDHSPAEGVITTAEWMPSARGIVVDGHVVRMPHRSSVTDPDSDTREFQLSYGTGESLFYMRSTDPAIPTVSEVGGNSRRELWVLTPGDKSPGKMLDILDIHSFPREPPAVSPDGRWIVYRDRSSDHVPHQSSTLAGHGGQRDQLDTIRVYDRVHRENRALISSDLSPEWRDNGGDQHKGFSAGGRFAISPDSKHLYVGYGGKVHKIDLMTGIDEIIPISIKVEQCLSPIIQHRYRVDDGPIGVKNIRSSTLSSDSRNLVFTALRRIYTMRVSDGQIRSLTDLPYGQFDPAISPDGEWVAFVTWSETHGGHVWRIPMQGGAAERLTADPGYYRHPAWSPDGLSIAYVGSTHIAANRPGFSVYSFGGQIHVLSFENRLAKKLRADARLDNPLRFTMDGQYITYAPYIERSSPPLKLSSIRIDGNDGHDMKFINDLLPNGGVVTAVISPSGHYIAAHKNWNIYLIKCLNSVYAIDKLESQSCSERQLTYDGGVDPVWDGSGAKLGWVSSNKYSQIEVAQLKFGLGKGHGPESPGLIPTEIAEIEDIYINLSVPKHSAKGAIALIGARVITMQGNEVIESGTIVVENGRIRSVGKANQTEVPPYAEVIHMEGKTVIPGFIDSHAHFTDLPRGLLARNHWQPLVTLALGTTTIKNPSNGGMHAFAYAEMVDAGEMVGPRMYGAEGIVSRDLTIDSYRDALGIARRSKKLGGTFIKYHTGWDRQRRKWLFDAARSAGMNVAAHWPVSNYVPGRLNLTTVTDGVTTAEHEISSSKDMFNDVKKYLLASGVSICFAPLNGHGGYPSRYWKFVLQDQRMRRFFLGDAPRTIDHQQWGGGRQR